MQAIAAILGVIGPVILWGLKKWIETLNLKDAQLKNYYAFLEDIDKHTKIDVTNYIAAGTARQATIDRIKAMRENERTQ